MINCKLAMKDITESPCGKTVCCHYCEEAMTCKNACNEPDDCSDQVSETDDLQVMEESLPNQIQELTDLVITAKKAEERINQIREQLLQVMEANNIKKFTNDKVSFTYVAPSTKKQFDKKALAKAHPEIDLSEFEKSSKVKASVRIQVK